MKKKSDQMNAFLGTNTEFEGKLSFTGAVRIDGRFKGEITTKGTLIVGETAVIESDIRASHLIISGEARGNIVAEKKIEIYPPGIVVGNIAAPIVTLDEGAILDGNCHMETHNAKNDKKVAVFPQESGQNSKT